jgi:hypothetical protein
MYLSPREAAEVVPGCPDPDTLYRWFKHGLLHHGRRVKLRAVRIGGRWYATRADLQAFLSTINPDLPGPAGAVAVDYGAATAIPPAGPREARLRHERTMERLRAKGLM